MRGKRHIAQNACISLRGARRLYYHFCVYVSHAPFCEPTDVSDGAIVSPDTFAADSRGRLSLQFAGWYEAFRRMCVRWLSAYGSCDLRLTAARYRPVIFLRSDADTCRDRRPDCPPQTLIKNAIPPDAHIRRLTHEPYLRYSLANPIFRPPHAVLSPHRRPKSPQAHPTGFSDHLSLSLRL